MYHPESEWRKYKTAEGHYETNVDFGHFPGTDAHLVLRIFAKDTRKCQGIL